MATAIDKTQLLATQILQRVGGEHNISKLENCMTRVRVEVHDEQKLNLAGIQTLEGIKGYIKQGEQHQFIVGPGAAAKVVDAMRELMIGKETCTPADTISLNKAQAKAKYSAPMSGDRKSTR